MKRLAPIFLCVLILMFIMTACGGNNTPGNTTTTDDPGNTTQGSENNDTSSEPVINNIEIFSAEHTSSYTIICSETAQKSIRQSSMELASSFRNAGVTIANESDWDRTPVTDYEILIGNTNRESDDFYVLDSDVLGDSGYIIKVVGQKVLIKGGTDDMTAAAVKYFISMIPKDGAMKIPENFELTYSKDAEITSVKYNGVDLSEFVVCYPKDNGICAIAASTLRREVFSRTGIILGVGESGKAAHEISIELVDNSNVFSFSAKGGKITFKGSERTGLSRGIKEFFSSVFDGQTGDFVIKENQSFDIDYKTFVTYEDFGAVGDGETDDAPALQAAHSYANKNGLKVLAREDATYYISPAVCVIKIMTDTDWSTANFIIDDRGVANRTESVFVIPHTYSSQPLSISSLKAGQENIGVTFPGDCLVIATNANVKQYIRYGSNQDSGAAMTDVFLVHKDGTVDENTPILWDFDQLTSIIYLQLESDTLTVSGGKFTTIANEDKSEYNYYARGIRIYRSNVIIDGLEHYITNEGTHGAPYNGFLMFYNTVDSEIRNVTLTAHKTYSTIGSAGKSVSMGTYDITVTSSVGFRAVNCKQTTDINDTKYWGIFASNYSKNITFDGCSFSRFDAHKGVCNVTLLNSTFGHQGINLIGHGTALLENCTIYSQYMVNLRSDYGSTWDGDLIIRNCTYTPIKGSSTYDPIIVGGSYIDTHDFGYTCYLPQNVIIDGLTINDTATKNSKTAPAIFANINKSFTSESYVPKYPMVTPKSITVSGLKIASGKQLVISSNKFMFGSLEIEFK